MSTLVIQLPPHRRLRSGDGVSDDTAAAGAELAYVLTADGINITRQGRAVAGLLPKAESAVVVLGESDVSWQQLTLPRAPAARLRAAVMGLLEERLLDEPDALHVALAPGAAAGQSVWVAVTDRTWLKAELSALDRAGVAVERAVPVAWPEDTPLGHFGAPSGDDARAPMRLTWSDANGVALLAVNGTLAKHMLSRWAGQPARWSAHPAVAAPAERWLGASVAVLSDEQRLLQAMRSLWNLLQFDLAPRHRGAVALREAMRRWRSASWRPVRWGAAALVAAQVVGLNAWAWHQDRQITAKRVAAEALLRTTYPNVRAVVDAPAQMARETDQLRAAAGRIGDADLETLLGVAAAGWPPGQAPLETMRFEKGRLSFSSTGWSEAQIAQLRAHLSGNGWDLVSEGGTLVITRASNPVKAS